MAWFDWVAVCPSSLHTWTLPQVLPVSSRLPSGFESRGAKGRFRVGPNLEKELRPVISWTRIPAGDSSFCLRGSQSAGRPG